MGEIQWQDNPWLDAVKAMDFTEEEKEIIEKYFGGE